MLWQILHADNVFVHFILLLYKQLLLYMHAVEIFHCTIHFINPITKEVPYETFSISFYFHKTVHENTFALTPPCFVIAKRPRRSFCQCSSFIVNDITES